MQKIERVILLEQDTTMPPYLEEIVPCFVEYGLGNHLV